MTVMQLGRAVDSSLMPAMMTLPACETATKFGVECFCEFPRKWRPYATYTTRDMADLCSARLERAGYATRIIEVTA